MNSNKQFEIGQINYKNGFKRGYQKGWRSGVKRGKTLAINTCIALGHVTSQPKGYYRALSEVIDNLELR
jgi:hypothetical protein